MLRTLLIAALLPVLAGCAFDRVARTSCPAFADPGPTDGLLAAKSSQGDPSPRMTPSIAADMVAREADLAEAAISDALRDRAAGVPPGRTITLNVVTLSAGGQYGAFGAGFVSGWSGNGRPVFDLVTGVSAGALLAPAVFAGPEFDDLLARYEGIGRDGILVQRPRIALLRAPSLARPGPLEAFLAETLDPSLVTAIAAGHAANRSLLIGATNLDTGIGETFDIGRAAGRPGAVPCIREALLASAAIPGLFPPRNIDGDLYADGGLRQHVFLRALDGARRDVARESGVRFRVEAYLIVNGSLLPPPLPVADSLPAYVLRSASILADEVLRDSIVEAVDFAAARPDWRLRGIRAELPDVEVTDPDAAPGAADRCIAPRPSDPDPPEIGGFDACTTAALYRHGHARARETPIAWLNARELRALAEEL